MSLNISDQHTSDSAFIRNDYNKAFHYIRRSLYHNVMSLEFHFKILRKTRTNLLNATVNLTLEQLNEIPKGFNNNIAWQMGHILVTQQLLVYRLSSIPSIVDQDMIEDFRKGTKPERKYEQAEIDMIRDMLVSTIDQTKENYNQNIFGEYKTYTTSYGMTLSSTDGAIIFNNSHEALHLGNVLALKRMITQ